MKRLFLACHYIFLASLLQINWPYMHVFISEVSILFLWSICLLFMSIPYCFSYHNFVILFEITKCDDFSFVLFLKIALAIQGLCDFTQIWTVLALSVKNAIGILIWIILSIDCFGYYGDFNNSIAKILKNGQRIWRGMFFS